MEPTSCQEDVEPDDDDDGDEDDKEDEEVFLPLSSSTTNAVVSCAWQLFKQTLSYTG